MSLFNWRAAVLTIVTRVTEQSNINPCVNLFPDPASRSLDMLDLLGQIETGLKIKVPEKVKKEIKDRMSLTLNELFEYLQKYFTESSAA